MIKTPPRTGLRRLLYVYGWRARYWCHDTESGRACRIALAWLQGLAGTAYVLYDVLLRAPAAEGHPAQAWVWYVVVLIASFLISAALAPRRQNATPQKSERPRVEDGATAIRTYGPNWMTDPVLIGWKDAGTDPIRKKAGKSLSFKTKWQTVGHHRKWIFQFAIQQGPVDEVIQIRGDDKPAWTGKLTATGSVAINKPALWGGEDGEGGMVGTFEIRFGAADQEPSAYLASQLGPNQSAFRGLLTATWRGGRWGTTVYPKAVAFLTNRILAGWDNDEPWYPEKAAIPVGSVDGLSEQFGSLSWSMPCTGPGGSSGICRADDQYSSFVAPGLAGTTYAVTLLINGSVETRRYVGGNLVGPRFMRGGAPDTNVLALHNIYLLRISDPPAEFYLNHDDSGLPFVRATFVDTPLSVEISAGARVELVALTIDGEQEEPSQWLTARVDAVHSGAIMGINPAHVLYDSLTSMVMDGEPVETINDASFRAAADRLHADGFGVGCRYDASQESTEAFQQRIQQLIGGRMSRDPVTSMWHLDLLRDDYDLDSLPILTDDDILEFEEEPSLLDEAVNQVVWEWHDVLKKEDRSTRPLQSRGAIRAFGAVNSQTITGREILSESLALRRATSELNQRSTPLLRHKLKTTRYPYSWRTGRYFRLQAPRHGVADMVCILGDINRGTLRSGAIMMTTVQHVASMPTTVFAGREPGGAETPSGVALPPPEQLTVETPYRDLVQILSDSDMAFLPATAGYSSTYAAMPVGGTEWRLYTRVEPAEYDEIGVFPWTPTAIVVDACRVDDPDGGLLRSHFTLADGQILDDVRVGTAAQWGSEVCRVDAINPDAMTVSLGRGCADTVPQEHDAGERVWFYDGFEAIDPFQRVAGDQVDAAAATRTSSDELPIENAPVTGVIMASRQARPYPPGNVRINGDAYPIAVSGDAVITWSNRDRVAQGATLHDTTAGDIGPEAGTTYTLEIYNDVTNIMVHSETGITGTTATVSSGVLPIRARAELYSVRDGLASWQRHVIHFAAGVEISGGPDRHGYVIGDAVSIQFTSTSEIEEWSISAGALPAGWALDPNTGEITGRAAGTAAGTHTFTVRGDTADGGAGTLSVTVRLGRMSLLMHMDGADGSTDFIDETGKPITRAGATAEIDTAQSVFGGASGLFGGNTGYLSAAPDADFMFGTGPFTISGRLRLANLPTSLFFAPFGNWYGGAPQDAFCLFMQPQRRLSFHTSTGAPSSSSAINAYPAAGTWFDCEVTRDETDTLRIFIDGAVVLEQSEFNRNMLANLPFRIAHNGVVTDQWPGWIDEFAVVKGVAEHVAPFTPRSAPRDWIKPVDYPRRWRILITGVQSGAIAAINELELRSTPGGPNIATGGTAYASSQFDGSVTPDKAFNGLSTGWASASPGIPAWLAYDLPTDVTVNEVAIRAGTSALEQYPSAITVQSSSDGGVTWSDEWSVSGIAAWTSGLQRVFTRP